MPSLMLHHQRCTYGEAPLVKDKKALDVLLKDDLCTKEKRDLTDWLTRPSKPICIKSVISIFWKIKSNFMLQLIQVLL